MGIVRLGHRIDTAELLDGPLDQSPELAGNLRDLARINRWTGADLLRHKALKRLLTARRAGVAVLLDVGGGCGDGLGTAGRWATGHGVAWQGILLDHSAPTLAFASPRSGVPFRPVRGDGRRLPLADRSVDVAACSLVLHHCAPEDACALLGEMRRVARLGVIVDDLLRSHLGYAGARLMAWALTGNALTRHDGPLSVRRAYTRPEIATLLRAAGLTALWQATTPGYRTVIAARATGGRP